MRSLVVASFAAVALMALPVSVRAAPTAPQGLVTVAPSSNIILARGGCGPGRHPQGWRDRWGRWHRHCVPNRW
ncbi:MAG TPA: hypothetical protein VHY35_18655 [Stellaceae bacterium]|jgi:hypothetical protein|nr:hypothetical protein [Stellaceae bacterium]